MNSFSSVLSEDCKRCSTEAMAAWEDHGKKGIKGGVQYGFSNPDLVAHEPLLSSKNEDLIRAKKLDCVIKNNLGKPEIALKAIEEILKDERMLALTFNTIWSFLRELREKDSEAYKKLKEKLSSSKSVRSYLARKLASNRVGLVRKITYYSFLKEVTGVRQPKIEDKIIDASIKILSGPLTARDYDQRDFRESLLNSLNSHGYLNKRFLDSILTNIKSPKSLFSFLSTSRSVRSLSNTQKQAITRHALSSPHFTEDVAKELNSLLKPSSLTTFQIKANQAANQEAFNMLMEKMGDKWFSKKYLSDNTNFHSDLAENLAHYGEKIENADKLVLRLLGENKDDGLSICSHSSWNIEKDGPKFSVL